MSDTDLSPRATGPIPGLAWMAAAAGLAMALILLVASLMFWGSSLTGGDVPGEITVAQAAEKREAGAFMLDVRQPDEWAEYHLPESTLIPLGELANRISELPRDRLIVVVCRSGNRSRQARDLLLQAGFDQVTSMQGGLSEWRAAGLPTVSGP